MMSIEKYIIRKIDGNYSQKTSHRRIKTCTDKTLFSTNFFHQKSSGDNSRIQFLQQLRQWVDW